MSSSFQSTLPVRGATKNFSQGNNSLKISIHAPREGSDVLQAIAASMQQISIHAPREGSDEIQQPVVRLRIISIHAPREGSDHPPRADVV